VRVLRPQTVLQIGSRLHRSNRNRIASRSIVHSFSETTRISALPTANLKVRPDRAIIDVSVSLEVESFGVALGHLQAASIRIQEVLHQGQFSLTDFSSQESSGKIGTQKLARLEGNLVFPLPVDDSFWERAKRMAKIDDLISGLKAEMRKQKFAVELRRHEPRYVIEDAEVFRPELIAQLVKRAKSYALEGTISKLQFEASVEQKTVSLEEVELSLSVAGQLEFHLKNAR
jgi:hypothetical protein